MFVVQSSSQITKRVERKLFVIPGTGLPLSSTQVQKYSRNLSLSTLSFYPTFNTIKETANANKKLSISIYFPLHPALLQTHISK